MLRRSDMCWVGLFTDILIEQVYMRSIKTPGGLAQGKGITENQRSAWRGGGFVDASMCNHQ